MQPPRMPADWIGAILIKSLLAGLLLAFVFVAGPTVELIEILISSTSDYLQHFLE